MKYILLISILFSMGAKADVVINISEEQPAYTLPPVNQLPPAPVKPALGYDKDVIRTPWGPLTFSGGYIGEGPYDYKLKAVLTCKNGRKITVFDLKFCDFKKNPEKLKENIDFNLHRSIMRFHYLEKVQPNAKGGVSCVNGKIEEKKIFCGGR